MKNFSAPASGLMLTISMAALVVGLGNYNAIAYDPLSSFAPWAPEPVNTGLKAEASESYRQKKRDLFAEISADLDNLSVEQQEKLLSDGLFLAYMNVHGPLANRPDLRPVYFDHWVDGLKDNFCRRFLDEVANFAYDSEGVKKLNLPAAKAGCPRASQAGLKETIKYVNEKLAEAFDDQYTLVQDSQKARYIQERMAGTFKLDRAGVGLKFTVDRSRTLSSPSQERPEPDTTTKQESDGAASPSDRTVDSVPKQRFQFNGLVYHAVAGGPANQAGVQDGDLIVKVDGKDVIGADYEHVINNMLLGEVGSKLKLTIKRGEQIFERTVVRSLVRPDAVWIRELSDGIYAVVVSEWRHNVKEEVLSALYRLQAVGARGIILDWRLNGGGLLEEAIITSSYFIEDGTLITERRRVPSAQISSIPGDDGFHYCSTIWERRSGQLFKISKDETSGKVDEQRMLIELSAIDKKTGEIHSYDGVDVPFIKNLPPVVVLINGGSGSATEIAAGSLKLNKSKEPGKNQGAYLIGEPSFGKGIEQKVGPAPMNTGLSVTSGRYFLNDGSWPGDAQKQRNPIQPDLLVEEPKEALLYTASDKQLMRAVEYLKQKNWKPELQSER